MPPHATPRWKNVPKLLGQLQTCWSTTLCIRRLEELWNALDNLSESCGDQVPIAALAALAATASFAQSSVTISGYLGASFDSASIANKNAARTGNTGETRVSDQSSRIIFGLVEDLGGGLKAIGQYDMRFNLDATPRLQVEKIDAPTVNPAAGGNSHVGLSSASLGTVRLGRQDVYYVDTPSLLPGGLYLAANMVPVYHSLANANASRTPNMTWWTSPRMNGFEVTAAYSTNPLRTSNTNEVENDMGTAGTQRKGSGTMLRLNYANGPLDVTLNTMNFKSDYIGGTAYASNTGAMGATQYGNADQKGTNLVAKYDLGGGWKVAAGTNNGATVATATGSETKANANAFSASYDLGAWNFAGHYAKRGNQKTDGVEAAGTDKTITSLAATYNFSKRTAVGVMYTALKSGANTATGLFYQGNNAYGGQMVSMNGETQKITSVALRHSF